MGPSPGSGTPHWRRWVTSIAVASVLLAAAAPLLTAVSSEFPSVPGHAVRSSELAVPSVVGVPAATGALQPVAPPGAVVDTVALINGTVSPFNYAPANLLDPCAGVADPAQGTVIVLDCASWDLVSIATATHQIRWSAFVGGAEPNAAMTLDPANGLLYIASESSEVAVVNASAGEVEAPLFVSGGAVSVAYDVATGDLYVGASRARPPSNVDVFDVAMGGSPTTLDVGGSPDGIAYDSANGRLFVTESASANVSVIDGANLTILGSIPVGTRPLEAAYDPANHRVYVSDYGCVGCSSGNVTVLNATDDSVLTTVAVPQLPVSLAYDNLSRTVYVGSFGGAGNVSFLNATSDTLVGALPAGIASEVLAYDASSGSVYVARSASPGAVGVYSVDAGTNVYSGVVLNGHRPSDLAIDPTNGRLYVTDEGTGTLDVLNGSSGEELGTVDVGFEPSAVVYDPTTSDLYVAILGGKNLTVVDPSDDRTAGSIPLGGQPLTLAVDGVNGDLYVTMTEATLSVAVIDPSNGSLVATIPSPAGFGGVTYDPATGDLYLAKVTGPYLQIVNGTTNRPTVSLNVSGFSVGPIAYDSATENLYTTNGVDLVIIGPHNTIVGTVPSPYYFSADAADPASGYVYGVASELFVGAVDAATGLPVGFPAGVQVGGFPSAIVDDAATGTLVVTDEYSGSLSVIEPVYALAIEETGLPASARLHHGWAATFDGLTQRSSGTEVNTTSVPAGTYSLFVTGPAGYVSNGSRVVTFPGALGVVVHFDRSRTVGVTFREAGLARGQSWCVALDGAALCSESRSVRFANLTPGTYPYTVEAPVAGQNITSRTGLAEHGPSATVDATRSAIVRVTFAYRYQVTFSEEGLATGSWSVTIHGVAETARAGAPIAFNLTNGTYAYRVSAETGYSRRATPRTLAVDGAGTAVAVTYAPRHG